MLILETGMYFIICSNLEHRKICRSKKTPLKLEEIWMTHVWFQSLQNFRDLVLFNLIIEC